MALSIKESVDKLREKYRTGGRYGYSVTDSRRQKLYNWERGHAKGVLESYHREELTLPECQKLVDQAYRFMGLSKAYENANGPEVTMLRKRRTSLWGGLIARGGAHGIQLSRAGMNKWTVLHEAAHGMIPTYCASHGPEYLRLLIELLAKFFRGTPGMSKRELIRSARQARLPVARAYLMQAIVRKKVPA